MPEDKLEQKERKEEQAQLNLLAGASLDACDDETLDEGIGGSLSTYASKVESTTRERPGEMMQRSKSITSPQS